MIAYVDASQRVHVANADGSEPRALEAASSAYTWPVWRPLGDSLAFSGMATGSNGSGHIRLYIHDLAEGAARAIYDNQPGADAIAPRTPHYALWSPDGETIAFVARTWPSGLSLFASRISEEGEPRRVLTGGPMFMSWSPDSRYLLVHSREEHYLVDFRADGSVARVPGNSRSYMAPSWAPDNSRLAILRQGEGDSQTLLVGDAEGATASAVAQVEGAAAFAWSPNGELIGLARDLQGRSRFYGGLWVADSKGGGERKLAGELILSFFWSPDGKEIAYITPSEGAEGAVRWGLVGVDGGPARYLADFRPTEEQLTAYMFFDQYTQSHDPWAPDGASLIFSGALGYHEERALLPGPDEANVLVAGVDGAEPPVAVARGFLGFWSPEAQG